MRNFLTTRWRHYAVAFVVAAASLGVIGACTPTKDQPPKPPPCTGADAQTTTCLQIQPIFQNFTTGQTFSFTITNLGPAVAQLGVTTTESGGSYTGVIDQGCLLKQLSPGQSCSTAVQATQNTMIHGVTDYVIQICDTCQRITNVPNLGGRGIAAQLVLE